MRNFLISIISFYQKYAGIIKKPSCVFYPTCSEYTKQALDKYGALKGMRLGLLRLLRCHPWQKNHMDPLR